MKGGSSDGLKAFLYFILYGDASLGRQAVVSRISSSFNAPPRDLEGFDRVRRLHQVHFTVPILRQS